MEINHGKHETGIIRRSILDQVSDITRPIRRGLEQGTAIIEQGREASIDAVESRIEQVNTSVKAAAERLRGQAQKEEAGANGDQLELSDRARVLAEARASEGKRELKAEELRRERVAALKQAYQNGELHSPERADQAARRILGAR